MWAPGAYCIDYRNRRPDCLGAFWNLVNWEFVSGNLWLTLLGALGFDPLAGLV